MSHAKFPRAGTPEAAAFYAKWDAAAGDRPRRLELARLFGSSWLGTKRWAADYRLYCKDKGINPLSPGADSAPPETPPTPEEVIASDVSRISKRGEEDYYRKLYTEAIKKLSEQDVIGNTIKSLAEAIPPVTVTAYEPRPYEPHAGSETAVLDLSCWHAGEKVDPAQTMGLAKYDMEVMARRFGYMFRVVLDLIELRRPNLYIPRLQVNGLGDMLSGDIHLELIKTNVDHMMGLAIRVASMWAQGLCFLYPHFERIDVDIIIGNHGRMDKKPYFKDRYVNWDYVVGQWLAAFCRNLPNVHIKIHKSPYAVIEVEGKKLLIGHGDDVKSWMGIPFYGLERFKTRTADMLAGKGIYIDGMHIAHFHQKAELPGTRGPTVINGSGKGGDEFSLGRLQSLSRPNQNLSHYHSKYGFLFTEQIFLEQADDKPEMALRDVLPDTWADIIDEIKPGKEV